MNAHRSHLLAALGALLALCGPLVAQPVRRGVYAQPVETPAVRAIRATRVPFAPRQTVALPTSVDNSLNMYFPPILDQSGGSCAQASGIGYLFTYEMNRHLGRDAKLSAANRFSYQFAWNMINGGEDQGGFVSEGLYLARQYGMMTEADYGLSSVYAFRWASGYDKYLRALHYRTERIISVSDSVPLIKRYLYDGGEGAATGGILSFSTQSSDWTIDNHYDGPSATGYHSLLTRLATTGAHALTLVGYDDLVAYTDSAGHRHTGAFIVVNSWGSYSHDRGRFYLPYDFFRTPRKESELSSTLTGVAVTTYNPQLVFRVNLTYSSRDDLMFGVGSSPDAAATRPLLFQYAYAFHNMGGDLPMQGTWGPASMELALDYASTATATTARRFFLDVIRASHGSTRGEGTVDGVQVYDYRLDADRPRVYTCRQELPRTLAMGQNVFVVPMAPRYVVSASPYRWLTAANRPTAETYLLHTAGGRHAKMRVTAYDPSTRTVTLRYTTFNR